jgi:bifunctional non-homologous end joining protein LigD
MMRQLEPLLPTLASEAPEGDDWIHEPKLDGYRLVAHVSGRRVALMSRRGHDWSGRFPELVRALSRLSPPRLVLDGEVVVLDERGLSDFQALQNSLKGGGRAKHVYFVFDLLFLGDDDLRDAPLVQRKEALRRLLIARHAPSDRVRYSDHVRGHGPEMFRRACEVGLEGIISKQAFAPYQGGRSTSWLKVKCGAQQEFVIGGFTAPRGSRSAMGALLLGVYEGGRLRYAGKVGTGFTDASLRELHARLLPLSTDEAPFADPPRGAAARGVTWVRPQLVAEVRFTGFTRDGYVRHPSFHGLRDDKQPVDVRRETAAAHP